MRGAARALAAAALTAAAPAGAVCADPSTCACTIASNGLVFGTYNQQSSSPTDSVGTITASCSSQDPGSSTFSVALSGGMSGNASQRAMSDGSRHLQYNLYTNATRATIWGDDSGSGASVVASFPPTSGSVQTLSVYGRIPPRQNVEPGYYSDLIAVTITF